MGGEGWPGLTVLSESGGPCPWAHGSDAFENEPPDFSPNMAKERFSLILLVCLGQGLSSPG